MRGIDTSPKRFASTGYRTDAICVRSRERQLFPPTSFGPGCDAPGPFLSVVPGCASHCASANRSLRLAAAFSEGNVGYADFCLGPLPPVASLTLNITKAGTSANYAFQPDFDKAVNLAAFSLDA